jgi:hypothetical protein
MTILRNVAATVAVLALSAAAHANVFVNYTVDAGGNNDQGLNGASAAAEFSIVGTELTIKLTNTSTGVPFGAEAADSLLASLAFTLLDGITITSGDSAEIGTGSVGLGMWAGQSDGFNVGDQWTWTNDGGGDLLAAFDQVISTSQGAGGATTTSFNGAVNPNVMGPFGGIAASPVLVPIPNDQEAVSDTIRFTMTLSGTLTKDQLQSIADSSVVEFGSDYQYLSVPTPGTLGLLAVAFLCSRRTRGRRA